MSTHNICFYEVIRKLLSRYPSNVELCTDSIMFSSGINRTSYLETSLI